MTHEDFKEELAYMQLEPWYDEQNILYLAQVAMMIAEVNRDRKQKPSNYQVKDFLFDFDPPPEMPITEDRIEAIFRGLAEAMPYRGASADGDNCKPSGES